MSAVKLARAHTHVRVKNFPRLILSLSLSLLSTREINSTRNRCRRSFFFPPPRPVSLERKLVSDQKKKIKKKREKEKKNVAWKFAASREFYFRSRSTVTSRAPLITFEIKVRFLRSSRHFYRPFSREFVVDLI